MTRNGNQVRVLDPVHARSSGAEEAGFYIGDSPQADARLVGNIATDSRFGILWRNAEGGTAVHNLAQGNCVGIMVLSGIPGLPGLAGRTVHARQRGSCQQPPLRGQ